MGSLGLLAALVPPVCPVCERPGPAPCPACWSRLRPAPPGPPPAGVDRCRSLLAYEGAGRELIARLKYRNARSALAWLATGMAGLTKHGIDTVTWAPTTPERRRQRGFDHAELLARAVARELGRPCRSQLRRGAGPPQTGRSREARQRGPTFTAPSPRALVDQQVLLVDDLLTTGATLVAAARALRAAGATSVVAVTAGRTPLKVPRPPADA